jgi:hypothetical protein
MVKIGFRRNEVANIDKCLRENKEFGGGKTQFFNTKTTKYRDSCLGKGGAS